MKFNEYKYLVLSDLFRYSKRIDVLSLLKCLFLVPGFKYSFWMRTTKFLKTRSSLLSPFYFFSRFILNKCQFKYGICIPYNTRIGSGFYIGHFGGIFIHHDTTIGKNCNINQDVSIGAAYGGKRPGVPWIGDNVFLGAGCKIMGGIRLGNNVAVGANCVVNIIVSDNAVVVGNPCRIVSYNGSGNYIVNTQYDFPVAVVTSHFQTT